MEQILANKPVSTMELPIDEARKRGAIAPFGEKYGAVVRLVEVPDFSLEFCGGTHAARTGDIGAFFIRHESSIASGVRRIEAVAGAAAARELREQRERLAGACHALSVKPDELPARIAALQSEVKSLQRELHEVRGEMARDEMRGLIEKPAIIGGVKVVVHRMDGLDAEGLREAADYVRDKVSPVVVVLGSAADGRVSLICAVTKDVSKQFPAGKIVKEVAAVVGGGGGGRPDLAQAGGKDAAKLNEALDKVPEIVEALAGK